MVGASTVRLKFMIWVDFSMMAFLFIFAENAGWHPTVQEAVANLLRDCVAEIEWHHENMKVEVQAL